MFANAVVFASGFVFALASASVLFKDTDPDYSNLLLQHARDLFNFADTYRGIYSNSIPDAAKFYRYFVHEKYI